jgi:hypothetical protein
MLQLYEKESMHQVTQKFLRISAIHLFKLRRNFRVSWQNQSVVAKSNKFATFLISPNKSYQNCLS